MQQISPPATRRRIDLPTFDAAIAEVRSLIATGYEKAGQWDLSQTCQHLAGAINATIDGLGDFKPPLLERMVARFFIKDAVLRSRRLRGGIEGPPQLMFPSTGDDAAALALFITAIERFRKHQGPCHNHPHFGKLTHAEWEQFHTIHASHHLGFLVPKTK